MSLLSTRLLAVSLALMLPAPAVAADERAADSAYTWDLGDLYASTDAWQKEYERVKAQAGMLSGYQHTLGNSPEALLAALSAISEVKKAALRLATYAQLKGDENVKIAANQELRQSAQALATLIAESTAWLNSEIIELGSAKIHALEEQSPELARRYRFLLDNALRYAPHTLGTEAEGIMAAASDILSRPDTIYSQLVDGELPWPTITLGDGKAVQLTAPAYIQYRQAPDRDDRKRVFDAFFQAHAAFQGVLGATLTTQVMGENFDARVRHFPGALADALFADNMPESVYRTLVAQANSSLPVLHRYLRLRKQLLGITDELGYYDLYAALVDVKSPPHFTVEQSKAIALEVTKAYGPEYVRLLKQGFAGRWMDLYPRPGKAAGAYMHPGAYDVHPYLLFNNNDDYESLSTFVHEWGHAVHSLLANKTQPFDYATYSSFIAETASVTNEMLLSDHMATHAVNDAEKLYYLGQQLELIRVDFFRQTMFAEFQLAIHEEIQNGGALSGQRLTDLYCGLLRKYYGEAQGVMKVDPAYCVEWAYIPHFYYGFYVYQNATSLAGAAAFAAALHSEPASARERFITMLKSGGSDYPYEVYRKAGLDMATPGPYQALAARMTRLMDEIEAIRARK